MTTHTRPTHLDSFISGATDAVTIINDIWDEIEAIQAERGAANGLAPLDAGSKVPVADLPVLQASGASHAAGVAPDPGATPGTAKFLREDATWVTPPGAGASGGTPAVVLGSSAAAGAASTFVRTDDTIAAFDGTVPATIAFGQSAATGAATKAARRDHGHGMAANPVMVASGGSHAAGLAPDPGSTAGTTRFLREDATWQTVGTGTTTQQDAAFVVNVSGAYTAYQGSNGAVIATGSDPGSVINSAITYVSGLSNGGTVALPNGNIQLTSTGIVGKPGVRLKGQGMIQQARAGDGYGTTIIGSASVDHTYIIDGLDAWGFFITDLNVNGNNKTANGIRLAAYRSTCLNVQASNCTTRNIWVTAGAASSPADAYVNMQLINVYVDGFGVNAKGIVVDGSLGSLVCSDGRIIGFDVFSCGNNGLEVRKADWVVQNGHVTANSGVTPADAGVYFASTGGVLDGVVVDSIGHGHFFTLAASGVRLDNCWAVYGGGTDNTHNAVNITAGSGVIVRSFFVQITSAGNVPNYVISNNGDPTGKMRLIDGVFLIGTGTGSPATGMIDFASDIAGSYWVRGVGSHT